MENEKQTEIKLKWLQIQKYFQNRLCQEPLDCSKIRYVAGVDVAYTKIGIQEYGCCSIIIIDYNTLNIIQEIGYIGEVDVEYHPGFLSFRELPLVLEASKQIEIMPDIFIFDGNGILHPKRMGIATHASFYLNKPCIGVAKTFFRVEENLSFDMPYNYIGASTNIVSKNNEILGIALRTRQNCKPIFVSVGNYMSLENAKTIIIHCVNKESRIPIPTRLADIETHKLRKKFLDTR